MPPAICPGICPQLSARPVCPRHLFSPAYPPVYQRRLSAPVRPRLFVCGVCLRLFARACVAAIIRCSLPGILFRRVALWWGIPVAPDSFCRREQYGKTKRPDFNLKSGLSCGTTRNRTMRSSVCISLNWISAKGTVSRGCSTEKPHHFAGFHGVDFLLRCKDNLLF